MRKVSDETKNRVRDWKAAAIADGWECVPTYHNEEADRACRLLKDGFIVQVLTREPKQYPWGNSGDEYTLHAWCPKGIAVVIPQPYSFDALKANMNLCDQCHQVKPEIVRVGFANRVCMDCEQAARKKIEYPGWNN